MDGEILLWRASTERVCFTVTILYMKKGGRRG